MFIKILSIIIILMVFNKANMPASAELTMIKSHSDIKQVEFLPLAPPSVREVNNQRQMRILQERLQITETRIVLTPEDNDGKQIRFSIWLPNKPIAGDDFILVSRPMILTYENITTVFDLLRAN